jgi:type III secretion protein Q
MSNDELYGDKVQTLAGEELYDDDVIMPADEELDGPPDDSSEVYEDEYGTPQYTAESSLAEQPDQSCPAPDPQPLDPLEQLPLEFTLRCGSLTLALSDLRRLCAGTVLEVAGVSPGYATLCHGERIVAEGELVDIDGRLGLQIIRMASHA